MRSFDKRPLTENSQRISASVFVRNFYLELKRKYLPEGLATPSSPIGVEAKLPTSDTSIDSIANKPAYHSKGILDLRKEECVKDLIKMIEAGSSLNLKQEINGNLEFTEPNKVRMVYTRSNLGKGFVFWFICEVCGRKVRYLYIPPNSQITACRRCHRLAYGNQNNDKRLRTFDGLLR